MQYEWFASPLDSYFDMTQYVSAYPEYMRVGALSFRITLDWACPTLGIRGGKAGIEVGRHVCLRTAARSELRSPSTQNRDDLRGLQDDSHVHVICNVCRFYHLYLDWRPTPKLQIYMHASSSRARSTTNSLLPHQTSIRIAACHTTHLVHALSRSCL